MQGNLKLSKPIFISLIMVLSTTLVPGCLDGSSDGESGVNATAPATPKEAMGLWLPVVDGYIGHQLMTLVFNPASLSMLQKALTWREVARTGLTSPLLVSTSTKPLIP